VFKSDITLPSYYDVRQTDRLTDSYKSIQCHCKFRCYCSGLGYRWPQMTLRWCVHCPIVMPRRTDYCLLYSL